MTTPAKTDLVVWRYGIISRLLHRNEAEESLENELNRLATQPFRKPDGTLVSFPRRPSANGCTAIGTADCPRWKMRQEKIWAATVLFQKYSKTAFSSYEASTRGELWPAFLRN